MSYHPSAGVAGSGAPTDAQYVTLASNTTLTVERVLTAGSGVSFTDGGAGGALTVTNQLIDPQYVTLASNATLLNERVLTAGSGVSFTDAGAGGALTITNTGAAAVHTHAAADITSGTLATAQGGTAIASYTTGDTLYASSSSILTKLAGNTSTTTQWLRQIGTGAISAAPAWGVPLLNQLTDPTGSVQFAQQQALQFRVENRTSDPGTPATGEMWFRTDL